ncbi:MAG: hypothetical protein WDW38_011130 [Sanguina aurantia]
MMAFAASAARLTISKPQSVSEATHSTFPSSEEDEANRNADIITHLPGYQGGAPLTGEHRSGYITVDRKRGRKLFYYFVASEDDPVNDPFVLWMNGGPGCSSFDGFIYEMGPFAFTLTAANRVQLTDRPARWNLKANVLYLESPAGVGFSSSRHRSDYVTNDTATTRDAEVFLRLWFQRHPQYTANPFFITGESYAGIYVPLLSLAVAEGNDKGRMPFINIQGYAVGNGCTDERIDGNALPLFGVGKSLLPYGEYMELQESCGGEFWNRTEGTECDALFNDLLNDVAGLNVYDVLEDCYHSPMPSSVTHRIAPSKLQTRHGDSWRPLNFHLATHGSSQTWACAQLGDAQEGGRLRIRQQPLMVQLLMVQLLMVQLLLSAGSARAITGLKQTPPCTDSRQASLWLNDPEVRAALHADPLDESDGPWDICSDRISYTHDAGSMIPVHRALMDTHGLHALIYSGDHDMAVPHTGSEAWTSGMGRERSGRGGRGLWETGRWLGMRSRMTSSRTPQSRVRATWEALAMLQRFLANEPL